jgi:hypothetical protein
MNHSLMKPLKKLLICGLLPFWSYSLLAEEPAEPKAYLLANVATVRATVEAIDPTLRVVTLKTEKGEIEKYVVGPEVVNFPQLKVGDTVTSTLEESISVLHLKNATAQTIEEQKSLLEKAPPGGKPGGVAEEKIRVVTTIESVDKTASTVTLKFPDKSLRTLKVKNPENLKTADPGDTVIITSTKKIAVKVTPNP